MLKVVIRIEVPKGCSKIIHKDSITLKRVQADPEGNIRALLIVKSTNGYQPAIIENHQCEFAKSLLDSGVIVLHAQIKRNEALWTLSCTWDGFRKLQANLDNLKLKYEIISKTRFFEESILTHTELEILKLALEYGYFENPKKVKIKELAEILGVSEATVSILIRRALKKVVEQAFAKTLNY
jgi:predicted DNA binding protein